MKSKKRMILIVTFSILLLFILWMIWGNITVALHKVTVASKDLPEEFSGYKIAQISDLHNTEFGEGNERLLAILKENQPDMIALTGDLIDSYHTDVAVAAEFLKEAMKIAPCYFVTGNHEARVGSAVYTELEQKLTALGVEILRNREIMIERDGEYISLIGIDDPSFTGAYMNAEEMKELCTRKYSVLLAHRPEAFRIYAEAGVDLALSGHAHGGQFRLPFVGGLIAPNQGFFPTYDAGLYENGGTKMMVSRGIGNSIIPIRFNNRPEIVLIQLENED